MKFRNITLSALLLLPSYYMYGSQDHPLTSGLWHAFEDIQHLLTFVGLGCASALLTASKKYFPWISFLAAMTLGGLLGMGKMITPLTEWAIAGSVLIYGIIIALRLNLSTGLHIVVAFLFGFYHGFAHGTLMPDKSSALIFLPGFILTAFAMTALTFFIASKGFSKFPKSWFIAGGTLVLAGLYLLIQLIQ